MNEDLICFDTDIWIKHLTNEEPREQSAAAQRLVDRALGSARIVAPAWAWAEVGSVLRKKVCMRLLPRHEARALWERFARFPIEFTDSPELRARAWEIAAQFDLPTLYDAAFLACTEIASFEEDFEGFEDDEEAAGEVTAERTGVREFWTADRALIRQLGAVRPAYVRLLAP